MSTNDRTWLSSQGYEQARHELERLLLSHRSGVDRPDGGADVEAWTRFEWRERRIRQLQELLLTAEIGGAPPDDGVAEAGMVLTVRFEGSADVETFLLANGDASVSAGMDVYSCASPIGQALVGAREGDTRTCLLPEGGTMSITVVTAKPYHDVPVLE
jgi:transcription elongation factor GreA